MVVVSLKKAWPLDGALLHRGLKNAQQGGVALSFTQEIDLVEQCASRRQRKAAQIASARESALLEAQGEKPLKKVQACRIGLQVGIQSRRRNRSQQSRTSKVGWGKECGERKRSEVRVGAEIRRLRNVRPPSNLAVEKIIKKDPERRLPRTYCLNEAPMEKRER